MNGLTEYEKFLIIRPLPPDHVYDIDGMPLIKKDSFEEFGNNQKYTTFSNINSVKDKQNHIITFFQYDNTLMRVWNNPIKYISKFKEFYALTTPDFSVYSNMNKIQIANSVYMNRWLGCIWQYAGIKVIPTITWANEDTYDICFSGIEKGSIVAISTIGCINDIESYLKGFNEMKKRLNPSLIIVKGKIIKGMSGKFINLDFSDTFNVSKNYEQLSFSTINRIYEIKEEDMYGWKRH